MSAKCEAALAEVAESKRMETRVPARTPAAPVENPRTVAPAASSPAINSPRRNNFTAATAPSPARKAETFTSRVPATAQAVKTPVPAAIPLEKAVSIVPPALSEYLEDRFQARFSRVVPASEAHVFSADGEIFVEKTDAPESQETDAAEEGANND